MKAIKTESAAALKYHFGVSAGVVWRWRKAFGVGGRGRLAAAEAEGADVPRPAARVSDLRAA